MNTPVSNDFNYKEYFFFYSTEVDENFQLRSGANHYPAESSKLKLQVEIA